MWGGTANFENSVAFSHPTVFASLRVLKIFQTVRSFFRLYNICIIYSVMFFRASCFPRHYGQFATERWGTTHAHHGRSDAIGKHPQGEEDFPQQNVNGGWGENDRSVAISQTCSKSSGLDSYSTWQSGKKNLTSIYSTLKIRSTVRTAVWLKQKYSCILL